jgi:hypothetical protein
MNRTISLDEVQRLIDAFASELGEDWLASQVATPVSPELPVVSDG